MVLSLPLLKVSPTLDIALETILLTSWIADVSDCGSVTTPNLLVSKFDCGIEVEGSLFIYRFKENIDPSEPPSDPYRLYKNAPIAPVIPIMIGT